MQPLVKFFLGKIDKIWINLTRFGQNLGRIEAKFGQKRLDCGKIVAKFG